MSAKTDCWFFQYTPYECLLHDLGKFSVQWQEYLLTENNSSLVSHAPQGAFFFYNITNALYGREGTCLPADIKFAQDAVRWIIRSHHGMFDLLNHAGMHALDRRTEKLQLKGAERMIYESAMVNAQDFLKSHLDETLIHKCISELSCAFNKLMDQEPHIINPCFALGLVVRFLLSALIDADWSDAKAFTGFEEPVLNNQPNMPCWEMMQDNLQHKLRQFKNDSDLNILRNQISQECLQKGQTPAGIYRLEVPTGGGKTLSVMNFALEHALYHKKERIVYVAPYKTIIDQTATEYRKALLQGPHVLDDLLIIEHHGDVLQTSHDFEKNQPRNYLMESWNGPVIITTMVQLLNCLFSSNKAALRRLHKLNNSILIIDEFQATPITSLSLLIRALNTLTKMFRLTVVLCTATLPPLEEVTKSQQGIIPSIHYAQEKDLVKDYGDIDTFKRVIIHNQCRQDQPYNESELHAFVKEQCSKFRTVAVILNTRSAARKLYLSMNEGGGNHEIVFLSNDLVPAHRKKIIERIRQDLSTGESPLLLISTSLIEAGIDISFECVIRSACGLDSIIQAAGRCNRHNELKKGHVIIVNPSQDIENITLLPEIQSGRDTMYALLNDFDSGNEKYGRSLDSRTTIKTYFRNYYSNFAKFSNFNCDNKKESGLKGTSSRLTNQFETSVGELLSENMININCYEHLHDGNAPEHILNQAFDTAGHNYHPIESEAIRVVVPWGNGKHIIEDLENLTPHQASKNVQLLVKQAELYSVSVYPHTMRILQEQNAIRFIDDLSMPILEEQFYAENIGLCLEPELGKK
ncbi:MAG: CRISPR-associated helicase Cas3' [Saccharofermentanales bacterium]|jgi:CRISPR-associated endonuclease/helicase Cas3